MIKKLFIKYKEVINYLVFGVLATLLNIACYKVFNVILGNHLFLLSNIIAWVITVIFAFFTNKLWVFESKEWKIKLVIKEMIGFFGGRLFSLGVEEVGLWLMIDAMNFSTYDGFSIVGLQIDGNMIAKIIMQVVVVIVNYVVSKFIVFKNKKEGKETTKEIK